MPVWSNLEPELAALGCDELLALFCTLEAPTIAEMNGEFTASMLRQPSMFAVAFWTWALRNPVWPGIWLGKAFRPDGDSQGRGYNAFRHFGRIVQRFPMRTLIAPSRYDGRPAFQLVYGAFRSACSIVNMVDEVRRVRPGVYLLIGTCGFTDAQRRVPNPFVLTGPVAPYRGDIGVERT
jgi:hypothetical protein